MAWLAFPASASMVYQHLPESINPAYTSQSGGTRLADDFDPAIGLAPGVNRIERVDWWGTNLLGTAPVFDITFFNGTLPSGSFGQPAGVVGITYQVTANVEQLGATTMFHYWVDLPTFNALGQTFNIVSGPRPFGQEYWLSIQHLSAGWVWALAGAGPTIGDEHWHAVRSAGAAWTENEGRDFAFAVTAIPEPGTWLLLSAGCALMAVARRRTVRQ